jgi:hypothetical protein
VNVPVGKDRVPQSAGSFVYPFHGFRLAFATRPQDAPILHFGGPLRMIVVKPDRFTAGMKVGVAYELEARVGTPGGEPVPGFAVRAHADVSTARVILAPSTFRKPYRTGELAIAARRKPADRAPLTPS